MRWFLTIVILAFFSGHHLAFSQPDPLKFKHITVAHGLSQNTVSSILKDSRGFMWFGTWDGLNRYDGYTFTIYHNNAEDPGSISGNRIVDMLEDAEGNLWVATADRGVSRYDRATGRFRQFLAKNNDPNSLSSNHTTSIIQDRAGMIWIGTSGGGLNKLDPQQLRFTHYQHQPADTNSISSNQVTRVYEDRRGNLWVGTDNKGLELFDRRHNRFLHYGHDPGNSRSISHNYVRRIFEDSQGKLWVGTSSGLNLLDQKTGTFSHFLPEPGNNKSISHHVVLSLAEDREGNLWVGTENGGISIFDHKRQGFSTINKNEGDPFGLNSPSIYSIYRDRHHNMWVGTFNGGANWVDQHEKKFTSYKPHSGDTNSLNESFVNAFAQDRKGYIWIATDGGGLNCFNPQNKSFSYYKHNPENANSLVGNHMIGLLVDREDNIWAGSWEAGVTRINPERTVFTRFQHDPHQPHSISSNNPNSFAEDQQGNIWFGSYGGGVNTFVKQLNQFIRQQEGALQIHGASASKFLRTILVDRNGNVWMGSLGAGLFFWDRKKNEHLHFSHQENEAGSLASNDVYSLFEDSMGNIWVGSSGGLNRYKPGKKDFEVFTKKNGLPSNAVMSIEQDAGGYLWLATKMGISKFKPETGYIRNYTQEDGLQGNEFNKASLKTRGGRIYFGGTEGFTVFHPDSVHDNPLPPPVYLTKFQIFNKEVPVGTKDSPLSRVITETKEIVLMHHQSVFSIEFAALNFTIPHKNQYAYKMEGFDEDWNYVGTKRAATYTNLNPGKYTFHVKAANNDGIWNETATSLHITIVPPWWQTWWVRIMAASIMAGLLFLYYKQRVNKVEDKNRKLDQLVEERTKALLLANEEISSINQELSSRQEEIKAQNENLSSANTEIALQRDLLSEQYEKLMEAQHIIKKQNCEILQHNQTLDEEVKARTKELVEYNHQLEQFAFITGHNLRAPVARILGLGQLLQLAGIGDEDEKFIREKLISTTQELDRVVKDINTILEVRKDNTLVRSNIALEEQFNLIKANVENDILQTNAEIEGDFSEVSTIYSVKPYIDSILFNLIHNGIKYRHPDRKPQISVRAKAMEDAVCLVVSDNGLGVDLDLHKKNMFTLYKRFHTHVEGKGMGLYLVKTQVAAMGGEIEVESQLNVGTTFRIFLKNNDTCGDSV